MLKSLFAEVLGVGIDPQHGGGSLAGFEWRYRVVVIFTDETRVEAEKQAAMLLADIEALHRRDIIVLEVRHDEAHALFGPDDELNPYAIRYDLDVSEGHFSVLLVGKDGTVKLRAEQPVAVERIFALIDQSPTPQADIAK